MRPTLLIASNFVREQRWPILVLLLWVLLLAFLGLLPDVARNREDLLFIFKQVAVYVVAFSVFFGGSAIYNERKTRRILAVLAKAVARHEYLSGLVLGVTLACAILFFALGLTGSWVLGQLGFPVAVVWSLMVSLVVACTLAGTVALMFSTFLNPFFSAGATALVLGAQLAIGYALKGRFAYLTPFYSLIHSVTESSYKVPGSWMGVAILAALLQTALFWVLAARIFTNVDIAVAVD
jgi:ABC-type transport system involved in multi-copper enzyme maturation permease subunit